MCELLGATFNREVNLTRTLSMFFARSEQHPDGWGVAYYPRQQKAAQVIKDTDTAHSSPLAKTILPHIYAKTQIAHIRKASIGAITYPNTHPFKKVYQRREWVFAHNGTIVDRRAYMHPSFAPIGKTDSEEIFCYLLTEMLNHKFTRIRGRGLKTHHLPEVKEILSTIKGTFNCLFSDGCNLYCFRDESGKRPLFYEHRMIGDVSGYIISTHPFTDNAKSVHPGQLLVFENGELIYS